ncbi:MAG: hypothetical protein ACREK7_04205 [Gemmatimonadota bacterium]
MLEALSRDDDAALTFCDQCGHLQPGLHAICERCGVPLDRSVYDPLMQIYQNAAVVRQAVRGRGKPSAFGKLALAVLGCLYLGHATLALLRDSLSVLGLFVALLELGIALLVFAGLGGMLRRDSWNEYRRWS